MCGGSGKIDTNHRYAAEVAYAVKVIKQRGKIWEGARPAFETGKYYDASLDRMIREGVIVPAKDPDGGYVLPKRQV
jgi:hypothetical protein